MFGEATGWYFVGTDYGDLKQVLKLLICGFFKILMFFLIILKTMLYRIFCKNLSFEESTNIQ